MGISAAWPLNDNWKNWILANSIQMYHVYMFTFFGAYPTKEK